MDVKAPSRLISFGDFTVDPKAGELRKHGLKIKLQEQPFQILVMLLERPGEVVTREEVRRKLWPNDTVVEFEHSIGTAIKKLRQALGDDAENPHFIETLPRRGIRLLVPVNGPDKAAEAAQRWREIERLCQAALDRPENQRATFLDQACAGDAALRDEVKSLLVHGGHGASFIESPALEVAAKVLAQDDSEMCREVEGEDPRLGTTVAHYRITEKLGAAA